MGNCSGGLWHCCGEGDLEPWRGSGGKVRRSTLRCWKMGGAGAEWLKCQNEVGRIYGTWKFWGMVYWCIMCIYISFFKSLVNKAFIAPRDAVNVGGTSG